MRTNINSNEVLNEYKNFLKIFSHDFSAPIRHIEEFVNILNNSINADIDEDTQECLFFINNSISKLKKMQFALLTLSKIQINEDVPPLISSNKLLNDALANLNDLIIKSNCHINAHKFITLLPRDFQTVFEALIKNAALYHDSTQGMQIAVTEEIKDDKIIYSVKDNGIGIPYNYHDQVFDIFRRLHGELEYEAGIGAGLTIAKSIIEKYNGEIWINSTPSYKTEVNFSYKTMN